MASYEDDQPDDFLIYSGLAGNELEGELGRVTVVLRTDGQKHALLLRKIGALTESLVRKHQAALDYLHWSYPGLPTTITNPALLAAISDPERSDAEVQVALSALTVDEAEASKAGIELLLERRAELAYFGVDGQLQAAFVNALEAQVAQHRLTYTSTEFHAKAKVYSITATGSQFDIGWIQVCTGRTQEQTYAADELSTRWEITAPFPVCDSSSEAAVPWYHVGVGWHCLQPTASRDVNLNGRSDYELCDGFNNCSIGDRIGYNEPQKVAALKQIAREQSFTAWLAVMPQGADKADKSSYQLLAQVDYQFELSVDCEVKNGAVVVSKSADVPHVPVIHIPAQAPLAVAALQPPTMNDVDSLQVYVGGQFKCAITDPILNV